MGILLNSRKSMDFANKPMVFGGDISGDLMTMGIQRSTPPWPAFSANLRCGKVGVCPKGKVAENPMNTHHGVHLTEI